MAKLTFGDMRAQFERPYRDWMAISRAWLNLSEGARRDLLGYVAVKVQPHELPMLLDRWMHWQDDPTRAEKAKGMVVLIEGLLEMWPADEETAFWTMVCHHVLHSELFGPALMWSLLDDRLADDTITRDHLLDLLSTRWSLPSIDASPPLVPRGKRGEVVSSFVLHYTWLALRLGKAVPEVRAAAERINVLGEFADVFYRHNHVPPQWMIEEWFSDYSYQYDDMFEESHSVQDEVAQALEVWSMMEPWSVDQWPDVLTHVRDGWELGWRSYDSDAW